MGTARRLAGEAADGLGKVSDREKLLVELLLGHFGDHKILGGYPEVCALTLVDESHHGLLILSLVAHWLSQFSGALESRLVHDGTFL
ncbi:MAG: hypothetical protein AAFU79_14315 [Myxococcota bacterium]